MGVGVTVGNIYYFWKGFDGAPCYMCRQKPKKVPMHKKLHKKIKSRMSNSLRSPRKDTKHRSNQASQSYYHKKGQLVGSIITKFFFFRLPPYLPTHHSPTLRPPSLSSLSSLPLLIHTLTHSLTHSLCRSGSFFNLRLLVGHG